MEPIENLSSLLKGLPGYEAVTDAMKTAALEGSRIPDGAGVWPGQPGYQPTYDFYYAATSLVGIMAARPFVKSTSSEGTSVSVQGADWAGLKATWAGLSPILSKQQGVLQAVPIPGGPHVHRTDMSGRDAFGRRTEYGDDDTVAG